MEPGFACGSESSSRHRPTERALTGSISRLVKFRCSGSHVTSHPSLCFLGEDEFCFRIPSVIWGEQYVSAAEK